MKREFTLEDLLKCAQREAAFRLGVYQRHGMTDARQRELELMEAIADHFHRLIQRAKDETGR